MGGPYCETCDHFHRVMGDSGECTDPAKRICISGEPIDSAPAVHRRAECPNHTGLTSDTIARLTRERDELKRLTRERACQTCAGIGMHQQRSGTGGVCDPEPCPDCDAGETIKSLARERDEMREALDRQRRIGRDHMLAEQAIAHKEYDAAIHKLLRCLDSGQLCNSAEMRDAREEVRALAGEEGA